MLSNVSLILTSKLSICLPILTVPRTSRVGVVGSIQLLASYPARTIGDTLRIFPKKQKDLMAYSGIKLPVSDVAVAKKVHDTVIRAGMAVSFQNDSARVPELAFCYGIIREVGGATHGLYIKQVQDVLGVIHSTQENLEKVTRLTQMM